MSEHEFWKDLGGIFDAILNYQKKNVEFNKQFINPWLRLGNIFDRADQHKEAVDAYSHAAEIDPESTQNWMNLGDAQFKNGEFVQAAISYLKAIELDPQSGWSKSNLALTYVMQNKFDEAIPLYLESIELFSDDQDKAISWNRLGNVYRKINDYQNAFTAFQNADKLDGNNTGFNDVLDDSTSETAEIPDGNILEQLVIDKEVQAESEGVSEISPNEVQADASEESTDDPGSELIIETSENEISDVVTPMDPQGSEEAVIGFGPNTAMMIEDEAEVDNTQSFNPADLESVVITKDEPIVMIVETEAIQEVSNPKTEELAKSSEIEFAAESPQAEIAESLLQGDENEAIEDLVSPTIDSIVGEVTNSSSEIAEIVSENSLEDEIEVTPSQPIDDSQDSPQQEFEPAETEEAVFQAEPEVNLEIEKEIVEQNASLSPEENMTEVEHISSNEIAENVSSEAAYEEYLIDVSEPAQYLETNENSSEQPFTEITPDGEVRIAMDTKNAHVWNELGNVYLNSGDYDDAIASYGKAIELDQYFAWPYSNLALAYVQKGSFAEAILLYQRGLELFATDKDKAITWNRLGNVYRRLGDYPNAIAAYQTADELDPENATLSLRSNFGLLGNVFADQKQG